MSTFTLIYLLSESENVQNEERAAARETQYRIIMMRAAPVNFIIDVRVTREIEYVGRGTRAMKSYTKAKTWITWSVFSDIHIS